MKNVAKIIMQAGGLQGLCVVEEDGNVSRNETARSAIKVKSEGFMDLCIECIGASPHGEGLVQISVCHYGEQNGDLMRDPDMVFDVNPSDDAQLGWCSGNWRPVSFRNDYVGVYQEAMSVDDGKVMVRPRLVKELKAFANIWDKNIKQQGFLAAAKAAWPNGMPLRI
jgi:hypothetical protein